MIPDRFHDRPRGWSYDRSHERSSAIVPRSTDIEQKSPGLRKAHSGISPADAAKSAAWAINPEYDNRVKRKHRRSAGYQRGV